MSQRHRLGDVSVLLLSIACAEAALRLCTTTSGHVSRLFGRPWYYLVPLSVPKEMPGIAPVAGVYRRYDEVLGWTINEGGSDPPLYYADRRGRRCSQRFYRGHAAVEDPPVPPDVVCLGDSFTHGDEVPFETAWPTILGELLSRRVGNLAVPGFGIDQATLRYQYSGLRARIVLLGLIAGDLERATTPVYNFTSGGLKTKPVFRFEGTTASIANQPAIHGEALMREFEKGASSEFFRLDWDFDGRLFQRSVLDRSYVARLARSALVWRARRQPPIYRTPGPRFEYCVKILLYLKDLAESRQGRLVVVLLDNNNTFSDRVAFARPWDLLRQRLEREGIDQIDTTEALTVLYVGDRSRVINAGGVHYTPTAHRFVAEIVANALKPILGSVESARAGGEG